MPMPSQYDLCLPLLKLTATGEETRLSDAEKQLADQFNLTEEERSERLQSGSLKIRNRVWWARHELKTAGFVEAHRTSYIRITEEGRKVLTNPPEKINHEFLMKLSLYRKRNRYSSQETNIVEKTANTPEDIIEATHGEMRDILANELLDKIISLSPDSFEQLIIEVLLAMGYGGAEDSGRRLGKSGDDGVDGVIDQDVLGLDRVYVQAKRYKPDNAVGSGDIRNFSGSLGMHKVTKGLFVTTSSFTKNARETANKTDKHIVLIGGQELARLMIHHDVGCRKKQSLHIREMDEEFFEGI